MAITEESRFELHQRLREVLGEEPGTTLMEHLPPADVATKQDVVAVKDDLVATEQRVTNRIERVAEDLTHTRLLLSERIESLDARVSERIQTLDTRVSERIQTLDTRVTQRMDTMATKADVKELRGDIYRVLVIQTISLVTVNAGILSGAVAFFGGR